MSIGRMGAVGAKPALAEPGPPGSMLGWWDASDAATITASGGNVTAWADKSGNGYTLTPITTGPATGSDTINGLNVFTYTGQFLRNISVPLIGKSLVYFTVLQINASETTYIAGGSADNTAPFLYAAQSGSSSTGLVVGFTSPSLYINGTVFSGTTRDNVYTTIGTGTPKLIRAHGTMVGYDSVSVGYKGAPFTFSDGSLVAEHIIYDAPSAGDITDTESYLTAKWGL